MLLRYINFVLKQFYRISRVMLDNVISDGPKTDLRKDGNLTDYLLKLPININ